MTEDAASEISAQDALEWRRLAPLTLLLAVVKLGPRTLQMIPALAAIGIAASWTYVVPALGMFLAISLGVAWAAWVRFRWRIGDDAIVIESGIFDRQHRTIPFDRIQDVSIEQGLIARALDLAKVGFETGASAENDTGDGQLDAITLADAEALRTTVRAWRSGGAVRSGALRGNLADGDIAADVAEPPDRLLFALTPQRLLLAGVFNFSLAALAVVAAAAQWFDDFLPFNLFDPRMWMGMARDAGVESWIYAHRWVSGLAAVAALLFVGVATGVVRTALANWNFMLSLGPRAFRRVRGLTTRTDVAIPLARIQAAVVATGLIRRRWGWHELRVQSLASDGKDDKDHQLLPFATLAEIDPVLGITGLTRPDDALDWQRPPLAYQCLGAVMIAVVLVAGGLIAVLLGHWQGAVPIALAALLLAGTALDARHHRWADDGAVLYIWRGWWSPRLTILPFANVQSADLADGPLLRRFGCAELVLGVPGESRMAAHSIDAVPDAAATALRRRILIARTARP